MYKNEYDEALKKLAWRWANETNEALRLAMEDNMNRLRQLRDEAPEAESFMDFSERPGDYEWRTSRGCK